MFYLSEKKELGRMNSLEIVEVEATSEKEKQAT